MNLYKQIENCTFDDIYVGDYIVSSQTDSENRTIIWLIADINNYLYSGDTALDKCHATIIPAYPLDEKSMNSSNDTTGGYKESKMYTETLGTDIDDSKQDILNKYLVPDFNDHILKYRNLVSDGMDSSRSNQYGATSGASSGWAWEDRYLDLMSEVNVYGSTVWSSSGYDIGIDNRQYAIFELKPEFINSYETSHFSYWLKAVSTLERFAYVGSYGDTYAGIASNLSGVRPRFLIK